MPAPLRNLAAGSAVAAALTGCTLVAGFGSTPVLGDIDATTAEGGAGEDATLPRADGSAPTQPAIDGATPKDSGTDSPVVPPDDAGGCSTGTTACDGGCVNTTDDPNNCGACGRACGAGFTCKASTCGDSVVLLAAGGHHVCVSLANGAVYCWGNDDHGQVGDGDAGGIVGAPVLIPRDDNGSTFANPTQLSLGSIHSCALFASGDMECWGDATLGELSDARFSPASLDGGLTLEPLPDPASQTLGRPPETTRYSYLSLSMGSTAQHGCAVTTADASVVCWGDNESGQLWVDGGATGQIDQACGVGGSTPCAPSPGLVVALPATTHLAAGEAHSCAIDAQGLVRCWGSPHYGQLGNGEQGDGTNQDPVLTLLDAGAASDIAAAEFGACAVVAGGAVWCWGYNDYGAVGHDAGVNDENCSLLLGHTQWCNGTPTLVSGLGPASRVAAGCNHACAMLTDGTVWCWGANDKGQLGTGDNSGAGYPRQVVGLSDVKGLSLGCDTSCAWKTDGTAWCWGDNAEGELANGQPTNSSTPLQIKLP
jgi:alpha-tubulin suppressor-like RCC1 family protein